MRLAKSFATSSAAALAIVAIAFSGASAQAFAQRSPQAGDAPAGDKAAITRVVDRYFAALNASDTRAILSVYSDDGVFLQPGNASWVGKAEIGKAYDTLFRTSQVEARARLTEVVAMSPDWAFGRALASGAITSRKTGAKQDGPTQELFVFRRQRGEWRIARFAFSTVASSPRSSAP